MHINTKLPKDNTFTLKDVESGQCAWIQEVPGQFGKEYNTLVMRVNYSDGIDSYVSLKTGFVPGPNHSFYNVCLDWPCIPVAVQATEI